jgi:hypothetical protein
MSLECMFFEITLNEELLKKYKNIQHISTEREFKLHEMKDNENKYLFWLSCMKKEMNNFEIIIKDKEPEDIYKNIIKKEIELKVIYDETLKIIKEGMPIKVGEKFFTIVVKYTIIDDNLIFLGSIYYVIETIKNHTYFKNQLLNHDETKNILFFLSIYKSIINNEIICEDQNINDEIMTYSKSMLLYLENKGKENSCIYLLTIPIGKMRTILINNGFKYGFMKSIGGKNKKSRKNKKRKRKTKRIFKN